MDGIGATLVVSQRLHLFSNAAVGRALRGSMFLEMRFHLLLLLRFSHGAQLRLLLFYNHRWLRWRQLRREEFCFRSRFLQFMFDVTILTNGSCCWIHVLTNRTGPQFGLELEEGEERIHRAVHISDTPCCRYHFWRYNVHSPNKTGCSSQSQTKTINYRSWRVVHRRKLTICIMQ